MKQIKIVMAFLTILVNAVFFALVALGESQYVSIKEIQESLPERWTGEYVVQNGAYKQLNKGDTISIDVPIVVPEVEAVPVVRITWEPPAEGLDESLDVTRDEWAAKGIDRNFPRGEMTFSLLESNVTFDPALPWEDAPAIAIDEFRKWMPFMKEKELTPYCQHSYGDSAGNGFQSIFFYTTYHGIPHLIVQPFLHEVDSEKSGVKGRPVTPSSMVVMSMKQPGVFMSNITTSKEVGVDIEDIPLLPFDEILKVLEQRVTEGYAYMLNEVRFGYMCFIDPEKKGEEFVLLPIWAAKGRTRADLSIPFELKTDQAIKDRGGYHSCDIIVINAQTGQVYDLYNDVRPDRLFVPHIITWDEVR